MGNYNSQYESYYEKILRRQREAPSYGGYSSYGESNGGYFKQSNKGTDLFSSEYFIKRIIRDLVGVALLFIFVFLCKIINTPNTMAVYAYSKNIVSTDFDYKATYESIKKINIAAIKEEIEDKTENIISKIFNRDKIQDKTKQEFTIPLKGEITSNFEERKDPFTGNIAKHTGIDIDAKEGTDVMTVYNGKVKEVGEDTIYGRYIVIDHGEGIESKYAHLEDISVEKNQLVDKGGVIGKSGNTGKSTAPHLHFEFWYMGQNKDPLKYLDQELFKN